MVGNAVLYRDAKTTIAQVMASTIINGTPNPVTGEVEHGEVCFIDVEGTYDAHWGDKLGINSDHLTLFQPDTAEDALDIATKAAGETYKDPATGQERGVYDAIFFDSIGALSFEAEQKATARDAHVGLAARKLSTWIRAITPLLRVSGTSLVATNHVSYNIGISFGSPETMPGGMKLRYAAAVICAFNAPQRIPKDIDKPVEAMVFRMRTAKNKTCSPQRRCEVQVRIDDFFGVDIVPEIASLTRAYDIVTNRDGQSHKGGHIFYQGEPVQYVKNGKTVTVGSEDALMDALYQSPTLRAELEGEVRLAILKENARDGKRLVHIDQAHMPDDLPVTDEDIPEEEVYEEEEA